MGSGRFPDEGFRYSAYVRNIRYQDTSSNFQEADELIPIIADSTYYDLDLLYSSDPLWKNYFYYGNVY